jgi:malic enzyme
VLFASGSPFPAMRYDGCEPLQPAQANNAYIFPAVGHAAVLTKAKAIPNEVRKQGPRLTHQAMAATGTSVALCAQIMITS